MPHALLQPRFYKKEATVILAATSCRFFATLLQERALPRAVGDERAVMGPRHVYLEKVFFLSLITARLKKTPAPYWR